MIQVEGELESYSLEARETSRRSLDEWSSLEADNQARTRRAEEAEASAARLAVCLKQMREELKGRGNEVEGLKAELVERQRRADAEKDAAVKLALAHQEEVQETEYERHGLQASLSLVRKREEELEFDVKRLQIKS